MSVPATNALSPAPLRTSTLTCSSASTCSQQSYRPSYIAQVSALRARGRLKVRNAIGPRHSYSSSSVCGTNSVITTCECRQALLTRVDQRARRLAHGRVERQLERQRGHVEDDAGIHDPARVERRLEAPHH